MHHLRLTHTSGAHLQFATNAVHCCHQETKTATSPSNINCHLTFKHKLPHSTYETYHTTGPQHHHGCEFDPFHRRQQCVLPGRKASEGASRNDLQLLLQPHAGLEAPAKQNILLLLLRTDATV